MPHSEAMVSFRCALRIIEVQHGPEHLLVASTVEEMALVQKDMGAHEKAERDL